MDYSKISGLGFVGLGAMGLPMAGHLAAKLPKDVHMFVFDINQASVDQLHRDYPDRITKCSGTKEVADKSVSTSVQSGARYGGRMHMLT